jgi:ribonucleoside-diphosphate reductase alpha chain
MRNYKEFNITIDYTRDNLLTPFAKSLLRQYYIKNQKLTYQEFFSMVACAYSNDKDHAQYMYDIISQLYFCPATPTLANAIYSNTEDHEHLPISCFLNSVQNTKASIMEIFQETMQVSLADGGLGTNWSNLGSIGEYLDDQNSPGCLPFIRTQASLLRTFGGSTREYGSGAAYMHISHPEIEVFLEMRKPAVGADQETRVPRHIHHGILITDNFLEAVEKGLPWGLKSVTTREEVKILDARTLWKKILALRVETGEPFLIFIDNVNRQRPEILKKLNLKIEMSNLCTEIVLPTGIDHLGNERTAICCLGSVNLLYYDIWKNDDKFLYNVGVFLDNVRLDFIKRAPESLKKAVYASKRDASIGLGVSGYSYYLQSKMIPLESTEANIYNKEIFSHIKIEMDKVSVKLAQERGANEDAQEAGIMERWNHKIALKPDALISYIFNVSPNTEVTTVIYNYKNNHGSHVIKNSLFEELLNKKNYNTEMVWQSILSTGNLNHLDFLTAEEKEVFKGPYEIKPMIVIEQAAARQPYICQAASLNLRIFLTPMLATKLHEIHMQAAKLGIKSLYYLETKSEFKIENSFSSSYTQHTQNDNNQKSTYDFDNINILGKTCIGCE